MVDWEVLGIRPTKDKSEIKNAYRRMLTKTNPEDDASKFMELRKAYDDAILWADTKDEDEEESKFDDSEIGMWMEDVDATYSNFGERIDKKHWKILLQDNVCMGIDSKMEAKEALLRYLMDHMNLPQYIWQMIDETFEIIQNKEELYDVFPKDYIDHMVVPSIIYPDIIDYELFNPDVDMDFDEFLELYFQLVRDIRNKEFKKAWEQLERINSYGQVHPYTEVERVKLLLYEKRLYEADLASSELYMQFEEDEVILFTRAEVFYAMGKYKEAKKYYGKLLEKNPKHYTGRVGVADCFKKEGKYEKAKELYVEIHKENPYDAYLKDSVEEVNKLLIAYYEKKCNEDFEDSHSRIELGWCYLQNNRIKDAIEVALQVIPTGNEYEYYNLLGRCYLYKADGKKAMEHIRSWIKIIEGLPKNADPENQKRRDKLSYAYELLSQACDLLGDREKAMEYIDQARKIQPENIGHMEAKARLLLINKKLNECVSLCDKIIEKEEKGFSSHYYKGVALFELRKYVEAYDEFEMAIRVFPYHLSAYLYKIRVLFKFDEFEKIESVLKYLKEQELNSDAITFFETKLDYERQCFENTKEEDSSEGLRGIDYDKFRTKYLVLLKNYESKKSDIGDIDKVYYELANTYVSEGKYQKALEYAVRAVNFNGNNEDALVCLAYIYENLKEYNLAIETRKKIIEVNPQSYNLYGRIAELYEEKGDFKEAISYHGMQLEQMESFYSYLSRGLCFLKMDQFEKAREDFLQATKINPDNPHAYNNIGASYQYEDRYEEAIEFYKKAIQRLEKEMTPLPYRNLATVYMRLRKIEQAVDCYKENIRLFNKPYDYEEMAMVYFEAERFKEAVEVYTKKNKIFDKSKAEGAADLYVWVAKCNLSLGAEKTAFKYYQKAIDECIQKKIKYVTAYVDMAKYQMLTMDYDMAVKYYKEVENSTNMAVSDLADYAFCLKKLGHDKEAEAILKRGFDELSEIDERHLHIKPNRLYQRGMCHVVSQNYEEAKKDFDEALSCRKCNTCDFLKCSNALYGLGFMYEQMQDPEKALEYYEKALEVSPADPEFTYAHDRVVEMLEELRSFHEVPGKVT